MERLAALIRKLTPLKERVKNLWNRYRSLKRSRQAAIAFGVALVLGFLFSLSSGGSSSEETASLPTVTVAPISALAGPVNGVSVIGNVRSVTEAAVFSQSGGTVTALHTSLGKSVSAGFVIAELENASQRASVLQAQGQYEAAVAARSGASPTDIAASARNTYVNAYSTLDTLLKSNIDLFFGATGSQGPQFLIGPTPFDFSYFPIRRQKLNDDMVLWRAHVATAGTADPQTLLDEADKVIQEAVALGNDLSLAANKTNTDATAAQLTALATARAGFNSLQSSVTGAKVAFQGQNTSATAGADASVKIALGTLRAAQAQLEKTLVRAPISGTVNFLPLHTGDYVAPFTHVATVAQNGALEIVAYVSEEARANLAAGTQVIVEEVYPGVITSISPALDPVTKQIEVHVALKSESPLVNGQSIRITLPGAQTTSSSGPLLLPLTALKLTPSARVVFSVDADGRLVAHSVDIGDVRGDKIEITSSLPPELEIVTDARGFSEREKVQVSLGI